MPLDSNEVVVILELIVDKFLDEEKDDVVVPQVEIANVERRVSFTHDTVNEIVRRERVRSTSPPAYEGVRSALGSQVLRCFRRVRNPPNSYMHSYKTSSKTLLPMAHYN